LSIISRVASRAQQGNTKKLLPRTTVSAITDLMRGQCMKTNIIYITASNMDEARTIGKDLVSNRLAACVNIIDSINSMYWWEGEIQDDREVVVIAKSKESLVPELIERVKSLHSYSCPCVVSLPILDGNKAFLDWIVEETR
jgi:periplasmic divalent cation tolerance protein